MIIVFEEMQFNESNSDYIPTDEELAEYTDWEQLQGGNQYERY